MKPKSVVTLCNCEICYDCQENADYYYERDNYRCEECERYSHKALDAGSKFWVKGIVRFSEGKFPGAD